MIGALSGVAQPVLPDTIGVHRDTLDAIAPQPFELRPFVMPTTLAVYRNGEAIDTAVVDLNPRTGDLFVRPLRRLERTDTLVAVYRTLPFRFRDVYRLRAVQRPDASATGRPEADSTVAARPDTVASDSLRGAGPFITVVEETDTTEAPAFRPFEGVSLERTGSISRGVAGGSNRDVAIESGLRLQLQGDLAEDVSVRAVLTDQNTPIQPQGTTQRLDDFDRVFIEIATPQGTAQLGDVDVAFGGTEFARFARKVQGITLQSDTWGPAAGLNEGSATVLGAVSRGQFRTQDVQPIDGVQGPYRLTGAQGERFIVVVAGSERVFLDGQRLERGRTNDYVIDYTRGEITFTPNRLITDDRRITVEFQYRTSQFDRTLVGGEAQAGIWRADDGRSRLRLGATYLREADGREFNAAFDLSESDSLALVQAGDREVLRSGAERVEFDPEAPYVHYRREVQGEDTVFVAVEDAPQEGEAVFRVQFTRVGPGEGAYVRSGRSQNGILYEYRGPGQGEYRPVEAIPRPQLQQLVDLHGTLEPVRGVEVFGEWARSLDDRNRLSERDAGDDRGAAYVAGARLRPLPLEVGATTVGTVSLEVQRRTRQRTFRTFDQARAVEFNRRWNLSRSGSAPTEQVVRAGTEQADLASLTWDVTDRTGVALDAGRLRYGDAFDASRLGGRVRIGEAGAPRVRSDADAVRSTSRLDGTEGTWIRHEHAVRQPVGRLTPYVEFEQERRVQEDRATGEAVSGSFAFWEARPGVSVSSSSVSGSASVGVRREEEALGGRLQSAARATTVQGRTSLTPSAPYDLSAQVGYRARTFEQAFTERGRTDTEAVLVQLDAGAQPWRRAVDARLFYDAATEREPTLQEVYVRTGPELGQFVWNDANGDGIQQIDEFIPETTPNEGTYVQSFVPSDSLSSVVSVETRLRLGLDPSRVWRTSPARLQRWIARVRTQSTVEVREKSRSGELARLYLLDLSAYRDPQTTLDGQLRLAQDVELFPQSPVAGVDVSWSQSRGLTERAAGEEERFLNAWQVQTRWRPAQAWTLRLAGATQTDRVLNQAFQDSRSYDIHTLQVEPEVSVRPAQAWRVTTAAVLARKSDAVADRTARVVRLPVEAEWGRAGRARLTGRIEASDVQLDGDAVGLAQFELTDGRGPGRSYLWGLSGRYSINDYLRATFAYDGRAPAEADVIHTFRVQLSASF